MIVEETEDYRLSRTPFRPYIVYKAIKASDGHSIFSQEVARSWNVTRKILSYFPEKMHYSIKDWVRKNPRTEDLFTY